MPETTCHHCGGSLPLHPFCLPPDPNSGITLLFCSALCRRINIYEKKVIKARDILRTFENILDGLRREWDSAHLDEQAEAIVRKQTTLTEQKED